MKAILASSGVRPSLHTYFITAMSSMALGLFSSLIIGLILRTAGEQTGIDALVAVGDLAMSMMGPAVGAAVAHALGAPPLVLFAAVAAGAAGAELGGPAGAFLAAVVAAEAGKLVSGRTRIDIVLTPLVTVVAGFAVARTAGPAIDAGLRRFGSVITWATEQHPLVMSVLVAVLMGLALTLPVSSAAIAVMLDLSGAAAGAAAVGCAAQMVGFAVSGFRDNGWGGLLAQGLGTSMLQIPNVFRNPCILLPPTLAGAVSAPIATVGFALENNAAGAGMGTSGLVGPIMTLNTMGSSSHVFALIAVFFFVLPAVLAWLFAVLLRRAGWIADGDQTIAKG